MHLNNECFKFILINLLAGDINLMMERNTRERERSDEKLKVCEPVSEAF